MTVQAYQPAPTGSGKIADGTIDTSANTMAAENTIKYGQAVKYGTDKEVQVKVWDGAGASDQFAGIALYGQTGDLDNEAYVKGNPVPVLKKGVAWVKVSASSSGVTVGKRAAVRNDGYFDVAPLTSASNGVYGVEIDGSEFFTNGSAGDLVKVSLNLPCKTTNVQL